MGSLEVTESNNSLAITEKRESTLDVAEFSTQRLAIEKSIGDAKGDLVGFSAADTPVRIPKASADGKVLQSAAAQTGGVQWADLPSGERACQIHFDGGGADIATGDPGSIDLLIPANLTLKFAQVIAQTTSGDGSGSCVIDMRKCTYTEYDDGSTHPVAGDSVCASAKLTISAANKVQESTFTGWTLDWDYQEIVRVLFDSLTDFKKVDVMLVFDPQ